MKIVGTFSAEEEKFLRDIVGGADCQDKISVIKLSPNEYLVKLLPSAEEAAIAHQKGRAPLRLKPFPCQNFEEVCDAVREALRIYELQNKGGVKKMDREGLLTIRTIGIDLARDMLNVAVAAAGTDMNVSGFVVIYSSTGMQLCSQAVGPDAKQMAVQIALAKAETVLNRRESTGIWQEKIAAKHTRPENYAGAVKTLFGGGLAIFADEGCKEFVGVIAFSGGEEWQDIKICQSAIESVGLYTDQID